MVFDIQRVIAAEMSVLPISIPMKAMPGNTVLLSLDTYKINATIPMPGNCIRYSIYVILSLSKIQNTLARGVSVSQPQIVL